MERRKGINVFVVLPNQDKLENKIRQEIIYNIKRNYLYDLKMRDIKDSNGKIYTCTNHLSLLEQNKLSDKESIKYATFIKNMQKIKKCDIIYFDKGWELDTECQILYEIAKEFNKDIIVNKHEKRKFVGYMRMYGLQEFEGAGYYQNIGIYYGDNMEELISNYVKYNKINIDDLKCRNDEYFDFGFPICFIPINEVFNSSNINDILDSTKGVGNPFK